MVAKLLVLLVSLGAALKVGNEIESLPCPWFVECVDSSCMTLPDVNCAACDPLGPGQSCADLISVDYNPSNGVIKKLRASESGVEVDWSDAICLKFQRCGQGPPRFFEICLGNGSGCSTAIPFQCQPCKKVGMVSNNVVTNYRCYCGRPGQT